MRPLPSQDKLAELFIYDRSTGVLYRRNSGKTAGSRRTDGYLAVEIKGHSYYVHRIVWKLVYGTDPVELDHKDQNKRNNRIENLREVTKSDNCCNRPQRRNKKLPTGISLQHGKYLAYIQKDGIFIRLGLFVELSVAVEARKAAVEIYHGIS